MATTTSQRRFRPRFRLRTFLVVVTIVCVWLGWHIYETRRQREAVAAIRAAWGEVYYDYQVDKDGLATRPHSRAPDFARKLLGDDFFHPVVYVVFSSSASARSGTDVDSLPAPEIGKLSKLRFLILRDYAIDDEDLRHFSELTRLETLSIANAGGVTDEGVGHLSPLRRLRVLTLRASKFSDPNHACRLGDASLGTVAQLPELQTLRLWGTFTDSGVSQLGRLEKLRHLSLGHRNPRHENEITDQSLQFVLELPSFDNLNLRHTMVTPEFVEQVQATHPKCEVNW